MKAEVDQAKQMKKVKRTFLQLTQLVEWNDAEQMFPRFTTEKQLQSFCPLFATVKNTNNPP
jgi:hypothetical protein